MKSFIRRYPYSLAIILLVTYLSFFRPPHTQLDKVVGIDKLVHTAMYFIMAGLLWWEFLRGRIKTQAPMWHAWVGAFLCPLLYGGIVELAQEYCTDHRGGEWLDFVVACRRGIKHDYDIVEGPMADEQIWDYVEDFMEGLITREAFWVLAKFKYPTHQIVFCTQKSLESITFEKSYSL